MRILGLDWGTARVGAAMSDEGAKLAFPLNTPFDSKKAIDEIKKLAEEYQIETIVLGRPTALSGENTESTTLTDKFADSLRKKVKAQIVFFDERLSSVASGKELQKQGIKEKDQRQVKDNVAAALILQQYLDSKNQT